MMIPSLAQKVSQGACYSESDLAGRTRCAASRSMWRWQRWQFHNQHSFGQGTDIGAIQTLTSAKPPFADH